jgi:hypothetical protein
MENSIKYRGFSIEFRAMLSTENSYFSKKRFESFCFFGVVLLSFIIFMAVNMATIEALEFLEVTGALMIYSGYTVTQIQKEKKNEIKN